MTNSNYQFCPMCDVGHLVPRADGTFSFKYARKQFEVANLSYVQCDNCHTKTYLPGQLKDNKRAIEKYQNELSAFISPAQILALREKYNLSQATAGLIFGGSKTGFSKWERGEVTPSAPSAKLMKLALDNPEYMKDLASISKVEVECNTKPDFERRRTQPGIWKSVAVDMIHKVHIPIQEPTIEQIYQEHMNMFYPGNPLDETHQKTVHKKHHVVLKDELFHLLGSSEVELSDQKEKRPWKRSKRHVNLARN